MKTRLITLLSAIGLMLGSLSVAADALDQGIAALQKGWAIANYQTPEEEQDAAFNKLTQQAQALVEAHPDKAEPLIWNAIIISSHAGASGGLGALGRVDDARLLLEAAEKIDPSAMNGSIYTSLGSLYYQVPFWPLSYGDDDKAEAYLKKALASNPEGIDPNFFYGDFLQDQGHYKEAVTYLDKALKAPDRANRPLADKGRRGEAQKLLEMVKAKL